MKKKSKAKKVTAGERFLMQAWSDNLINVRTYSDKNYLSQLDRFIKSREARAARAATKAERERCVGIVAARRDHSFAHFDYYERGVCDQMIDSIREANP